MLFQKRKHQAKAFALTEKIYRHLGLRCCLRVCPVTNISKFKERLTSVSTVFCLILLVSKVEDSVGYFLFLGEVGRSVEIKTNTLFLFFFRFV